MKQQLIAYFKSKKFIRYFILMLILSIAGQLLQSYWEYGKLIWLPIILLMLGDFISTFVIYYLFGNKEKNKKK